MKGRKTKKTWRNGVQARQKGPATNSAEFRTLIWGTLMADESTHYHLARQISRHPKGIHLWRKYIEMLVIL